MSRILIGTAALAFLLAAGAAQAQFGEANGNTGLGNTGGFGANLLPGDRKLTPEEAQREREIESKYNATKDRIPDKKAANDPWGNIRSTPAPSASKQQK